MGFFLVIKYLYRQTQWLILVLPVKTAIFRWEIHHDPAPKKALDEGVSDAHFGEKLLGPGPPRAKSGLRTAATKLNMLNLRIEWYLDWNMGLQYFQFHLSKLLESDCSFPSLCVCVSTFALKGKAKHQGSHVPAMSHVPCPMSHVPCPMSHVPPPGIPKRRGPNRLANRPMVTAPQESSRRAPKGGAL